MWTYDNEFSFPFLNLNKIFKNSTPGKVAYIWHIERVQIDVIKFERMQIHSFTDALPLLLSLLKVIKESWWTKLPVEHCERNLHYTATWPFLKSGCLKEVQLNSLSSVINQIGHFRVPKNPHFQNEAKCTIFLSKMTFICMRMKNSFHIKGWALNLVLIQRPGETRKWPIGCDGVKWALPAIPRPLHCRLRSLAGLSWSDIIACLVAWTWETTKKGC